MNRRRLLVLGDGGLLSAEVKPAFRALDWDVIGATVKDCDITDAASVARMLSSAKADLIINCAAYTAVDKAETDEAEAVRINATGAGIAARGAAAAGIPFFHISTDYVFDGQQATPYAEDAKANPLGAYARSKWQGEEAVRAAKGAWTIVRTGELYGDAGPSFFAAIFKRALAGQPLKVVNDQLVSPTWTRELAKQLAHMALVAKPGLYHATCGGSVTWFDAARFALQEAGLRVPLEPVSTETYGSPTPRPLNSVLSHGALEAAGLYVMRQWDETLKEWVGQTGLLAGAKR
ncbi:MAG: dTDP-4-dehydrorhamnose reductase [Myxococcaceae bacterium]|nr:dTDP-4-dehydrorhamnose reductase [Myxococcaceae bacterium]